MLGSHRPVTRFATALAAVGLLAGFAAAAPAADPSHWQTDFGPLFLEQAGSELRGLYPDYRGEVRGELDADGEWFHGVWVQLESERRCERALDGARYWGTLSLQGLTGDRFEGMWAYCDDTPGSGGAWGGRRTGGGRLVAPATYASTDGGLDAAPAAGAAVSLDEARAFMRFEYGQVFPFDSARFLPADLDCDGTADVAVAWVEGTDPEAIGELRVALVRREGELLVHERRDAAACATAGPGPELALETGEGGGCPARLRAGRGEGCPVLLYRWWPDAAAGERLVVTP